MTTFYLIRHAEREVPTEVMAARRPGVHLTERGRQQADRLARRLAGAAIQQIFSSPMERAQETAAPLARALGITVQIAPGLNEVDFGDWTGLSVAELEGFARWRSFNVFRSATPLPGGEDYAAVQARMVAEVLRLRDTYPGQRVALVSHADPLRVLLTYLLGMPVDFFDRIEIDMASFSILEIGTARVRVLRLNETVEEA